MIRTLLLGLGAFALAACGSTLDATYPAEGYGPDGVYGGAYPAGSPHAGRSPNNAGAIQRPARPRALMTPIPSGLLPDRTAFMQDDPRWGKDRLGPTKASMAAEGCVITSVAMALGNLGFPTNPGDLNKRLTATDNFTPRGWLIWNGVSDVTDGAAKAHYYDTVSEPLIQSCIARGDYPLVRFTLANGRSHWAMILGRTSQGFYMRDPLRDSKGPLLFPRDASAFEALRCIGLADG